MNPTDDTDEVGLYDALVRMNMQFGQSPAEARANANKKLEILTTKSEWFGVVKAEENKS